MKDEENLIGCTAQGVDPQRQDGSHAVSMVVDMEYLPSATADNFTPPGDAAIQVCVNEILQCIENHKPPPNAGTSINMLGNLDAAFTSGRYTHNRGHPVADMGELKICPGTFDSLELMPT